MSKRIEGAVWALILLVPTMCILTLLFNGNPLSVLILPTLVPTIPLVTLPAPAVAFAALPPTLTPSDTPAPTSTSPPPAAELTPTPYPTPTATPTATPTHVPTSTPIPTVPPPRESAPALLLPTFAAPEPITQTFPLTGALPIPTPVPVIETSPETINIIVLGSDRRPTWSEWHTDVVQLVSIQPSIPAVTILSIPRDLYVYIPGFWMSRINFADFYGETYGAEGGGFGLIQQTMLYNLGIRVDHYVRTDFDGLIGIVDALGGIDVPVHCRLQDHWPYPDETGQYPIKVLEPGVHHMDGETALWYARSRLTSSTFAREKRQQQVLQAIWRKARSGDLLRRLPDLWPQLRELVVTDMTFEDVAHLAAIGFRLDERNVRFRNIGYQHVIPWTTPKGGSVFLPRWEEIEPVLREALSPPPEGRMWRTLHTVEVWNGSEHEQWEHLAADRLLREGFSVVISQPEQRDYAHTTLVDFSLTPKGSAAAYLSRMFNIPPANVTHLPDPNAPVRYRLIIGADYEPCRSP
ncbi:MAG: LCP family protein [Anaerolineae bacterium]|nr:LCP family protein [Anaerolineae bacterium]